MSDYEGWLAILRAAVERGGPSSSLKDDQTPEAIEDYAARMHDLFLGATHYMSAERALAPPSGASDDDWTNQQRTLRELISAVGTLSRQWSERASSYRVASVQEVVSFATGAVGSGVLGGAAYEAGKAAASRLIRRTPPGGGDDYSERPQVWSVARNAVLSRYSDHFATTKDDLHLEPHSEEVRDDGRWLLEFASVSGDQYTVIMGPRRPVGGWAASVRAVKRVRNTQSPPASG